MEEIAYDTFTINLTDTKVNVAHIQNLQNVLDISETDYSSKRKTFINSINHRFSESIVLSDKEKFAEQKLESLVTELKKEMGFDVPVTIVFESDQENANRPLGKTAYYDPSNKAITVFYTGRHPKDCLLYTSPSPRDS